MATLGEKIEAGWIHVNVIVEMLGAPKDYIQDTLKSYVEKMKQQSDLDILKTKFSKPKKQEELFSVFVEIEMLVKGASALAYFCFDYMPSSIEIMDPQSFKYSAADFANFFNDLQGRLHRLDMIVKNLRAETKVMQTNAARLLRNNIMISLKEKDKDLKLLSRNVGIPEKQLKPILKGMVEEGYIKEKEGKYAV